MNTSLNALRQSAAYLLGIAVHTLFPKSQLIQGGISDIGFYYDFQLNQPLLRDQLKVIEERMHDLARQDMPIQKLEMMRKNAMELFKYHTQDLKVALLKTLQEDLISICKIESYYDLFAGEILDSFAGVKVFKLLEIIPFKKTLPGRKNLNCVRILGTAFFENQDLKEFLKKLEIAKKRDHRLLVKEMGLLTTFPETSQESWCWLPKGEVFKEQLVTFLGNEFKQQNLAKVKTSSLKKNHQESFPLLALSEEESYSVILSKLTQHKLIYQSKERFSKDLPIGFYEIGSFIQNKRKNEDSGLFDTLEFESDSETLFCEPEQLEQEVISSLQFIDKVVKIFGFEVYWHLTTKSCHLRSASNLKWDTAKNTLVKALQMCNIEYTLDNQEKDTYGPTVEVRILDVLGRSWICSYLSIDVLSKENLKLQYKSRDGQVKEPIVITRSLFSSFERLVALLVENELFQMNVLSEK